MVSYPKLIALLCSIKLPLPTMITLESHTH